MLDGQNDYQYRSFGVPGLGIKRGLDEDLVVAPYASMLALSRAPREVSKNLERLEAMDALGTHGLFEAIDFHSTGTTRRRQARAMRSRRLRWFARTWRTTRR